MTDHNTEYCPNCRRDLDGGPGGVCPICISGTVDLTPARAILAGSPLAALDYATAYRIVFGEDLQRRCLRLVAEYGTASDRPFEDGGVCWELGQYGQTPAGVLEMITRHIGTTA